MKILGVIPARGGSKGLPLKNIAPLAGRTMLDWTIDAAKEVEKIGLILVSTDHEKIASHAYDAGVGVVDRPPELGKDLTPTAPVIEHAWKTACERGFNADCVVTLQPTSPLRKGVHIREAIELFLSNPGADSLISIQRVPHQFSPVSLMERHGVWTNPVSEGLTLRRQDKPNYWCRNGAAIYITKSTNLRRFVWGGKVLAYEMNKVSSLDVDDEEDLIVAEALLSMNWNLEKTLAYKKLEGYHK
jgi:CMP-N-acetylneuraminic acid synthetase